MPQGVPGQGKLACQLWWSGSAGARHGRVGWPAGFGEAGNRRAQGQARQEYQSKRRVQNGSICVSIPGESSKVSVSSNISTSGSTEKKGQKNLFENLMSENFPKLGKEADIQIQEAQGVPLADV